MMMNSKNQLSELLSAMNFPSAGDTLNGVKVISASASMENDILKYEVVFPKGTKTKQIPSLLAKFFATQIIPTEENLIVRHHDYTVKPKTGKVAVVGAMHILSVVRANPGAQEFDEDYSKMEMTNPETYFRKHQCGAINSPQFRAKMFTFVSLMGENYGYGLDNCVYHRRASLIMPKIKITKAVPQAKMMYHTHPRKDEPSLSSPDDYLLYMDLSHKPRSIRHFYTVMADRMDYFHITPKKDSKNNYLKLDEDGIIKELDAEMNDIEAKWDKKTPKTGKYQDDLRFCENITRDVVKWLNKKYGKYFIIKYKCYYKVKKNPPVPEIDDLHLKDEVVEIALESIKQRTQGLAPPNNKSHENYAYWHHLRSLDTLQGSAKTLGISPQGSHKRTHQRYMNKAFEDTQYNYHDVLNILNLAHDIAKEDSKIRDGGELLSRMEEICEYLEISETGTETLQFLEDVIHNENLFTEEAMTMCGDFYGLALLSSYAIQAVGAIGEIKKGTKEYQLIEYEIYTNLKSETQTRFQDFLVGEIERSGKAFGENAPIAQGFVDSFLNPQVTLKRTDFEHEFPPEAFAYDFDLVKEALDEFNRNKYEPTKEFITLGRIHLRFPVTSGSVSMSITLRTGKAQIFVTGRPNAMEDALDAVTKVGTALVRYGLPGIDPEEYDVQAIDVAQNPQTSQVIAIAGPSGAGKSTTIRNLLNLLPNSKTVPTVTTRQKRKSDKPGERVFTSPEKFKKDMRKGNMVAAQLQKNGNYYGRRKSDFEGADYVIVDVNLKGINAIKRAYPNTFTVYLEPVEDPEFIRKRLLRRGDMSPQEARGRASIIPSHIKDSKNIDFNARIQTKQGEFAKIALELEPMIPKQNPSISNLVSSLYGKEEEEEEVSIKVTKGSNVNVSGDIISGDVINLQAGSTMIADNLVSGNLTKSNPSKKPKTIRIEESPNKEKKLVAYFYDKDGKKFRTVHFGARGMSDYTQHKDPKRMKRYVARHGGMGENWKDPMTAGALSRWILWGKPSLRESFNDFKKRFNLEGVMAVTNTRMNPSNIPFPIPEEYQEELESRLAEEMTRPGYRPHTIPEVIEEGLYDDSPSDFSYAQGEYEEFLEEIEKGDLDEAYAEYSDVEGHVAYWLYTNHRVIMPIYAQSHLAKTRGRIQIFKDLFEHYGYEHSPAYLKGGSNHEKVFKVRAALDAAADAQGKPRITDNDDQLSSVVKNIVEARKNPRNPMAPGYQSYGWTTQDWRSIKVNNKGDIDYSEKCGAEGTKTPSGSPRLCLPAAVVKSLIRTDSGKDVIRTQARKKARAKKGERVPWHPRIKKIWKRIEDKTVKDKPNPPSFISARDPQKWSDRYDKIIKMSGDELMQLAEKQAAEKGLTIELTITNREYKENSRRLKLPPKQQKMYKEYIESLERVTISLSRGNKLVDRLRFTILNQSPKELVDYLTNRKVWRKESNGKSLPQIGSVRTQYEGNKRQRMFRVSEIPIVATLQNNKRFPFAVAGGGGYLMSEGQTSKGYYGIIKTYQAGFLEANDMEQYGMGASPMRSDLYQSYGWLTAFSYKDNYPYPSRAAEYYLNIAGKSKLANKDADYWNIYRPVYSKKNPSEADFFPGNKNVAPYYMTAQTIPITALQNGGEWRHGEFAEEDPFEEYFE